MDKDIGPHYQYDPSNNSFVPFDNNHSYSNEKPYTFHANLENVENSDPDLSSLNNGPTPSSSTESSARIRRPRNAFIVFRSEFLAGRKIDKAVEHDHRHISRIVAHYWNNMSESEKQVYRFKADTEKMEHIKRHPGYRFKPKTRPKKTIIKRKVKRNGEDDVERCRRVADLLRAGKEGNDLVQAVNAIENPSTFSSQPENPPPESSALAVITPSPSTLDWRYTQTPEQCTPSFFPYNYDYFSRPSIVAPATNEDSHRISVRSGIRSGQDYRSDTFYSSETLSGWQTSDLRSGSDTLSSYSEVASFSERAHYAPNGELFDHSVPSVDWTHSPIRGNTFEETNILAPKRHLFDGSYHHPSSHTHSSASSMNSASQSSSTSSTTSRFSTQSFLGYTNVSPSTLGRHVMQSSPNSSELFSSFGSGSLLQRSDEAQN